MGITKNSTGPSQTDILEVFRLLNAEYPDAKTELIYETPFQLLIAVILSAQCTDARVNLTTPVLFRTYPTAATLAKAEPLAIEKIIHSCGFYRAKAKAIIATARDLVEKFNEKVPETLEELITLAGVGRKTASVILNQAFNLPAIAVDTHVKRVSNRLGWALSEDPVKIEFELRALVPMKWWGSINTLLILHGRRTCVARRPKCETCFIRDYCFYFRNFEPKAPAKKVKKKKTSKRQITKRARI